jgi:competence protein ComEC
MIKYEYIYLRGLFMVLKRFLSFLLILTLTASLLIGCNGKELKYSDDCLTVYLFDVGQADNSLLIFPDGTTMLIDAGNRNDGKLIANYLKNLGVSNLDYLVGTHPHEDHIGGMNDIFNAFNVKTVCVPLIPNEFKPTTEIYTDFNNNIKKEGSRLLELSAETVIAERENFNVTSLAPSVDGIYSNLNDYSLVLLVNCFTNTILFTGDTEKPSELDMLRLNTNLDADILKVGHHGGENSSTAEFLNKVTPKAAVISSGVGNTYGHPNEEALKRLSDIGAKVYRTDTVGTVIAKCYDGGFNIETDENLILDGSR